MDFDLLMTLVIAQLMGETRVIGLPSHAITMQKINLKLKEVLKLSMAQQFC